MRLHASSFAIEAPLRGLPCLSFSAVAPDGVEARQPIGYPRRVSAHSMTDCALLAQTWHAQYSLHIRRIPPNATIARWPGVPQPPHLVDCVAQWAEQKRWDEHGPELEEPEWARAEPPQPPWVSGPGGSSAYFLGCCDLLRSSLHSKSPHVCARGRHHAPGICEAKT